jgi:hypothetical protein
MPSSSCRFALFSLSFAMVLSLGGCGSVLTQTTSDAAGVAAAGISSAVTKNGSVTAAIGLGVQSLASSGLNIVERRVHHREQANIAQAAGALAVGQVASWSVDHTIPIEPDESGRVTVSQVYGGALFTCKDIVFSVDHAAKSGPVHNFYVTTICKNGDTWEWAQADPATSRWSGLQ